MTKKIRILAVVTTLIGFIRPSRMYVNAIKNMEDVELHVIEISGEDYKTYLPKTRIQYSQARDMAEVARRKVKAHGKFEYDILFICGLEIILGLQEEIKRHKSVLVYDILPNQVHGQHHKNAETMMQKLRAVAASMVTMQAIKAPMKEIDIFLPLSQ